MGKDISKTGGTSDKGAVTPSSSSQKEVDAFVRNLAAVPSAGKGASRGRLIFAMDATASREPSWDHACHLQAEMFQETSALGGLDVQLVYFRGFRECRASQWVSSSDELVEKMVKVRCAGGLTQLNRVLRHAHKEAEKQQVNALVYVGDAFEEAVDRVSDTAGRLGLMGLRCFMFHEGTDPVAGRAFRQVAALSGGAYCSFDAGSAQQLRDLLSAVAVYAAGGRPALEDFGKRRGGAVPQLTHQVK